MTTVLRPALVWKEVRGLGPTWLTAAALLVAIGFVETGLDTVLDVQQPRAGAVLVGRKHQTVRNVGAARAGLREDKAAGKGAHCHWP